MRFFEVEMRETAAGLRAVVVERRTGRVVGVAESLRDAWRIAAVFERRAL